MSKLKLFALLLSLFWLNETMLAQNQQCIDFEDNIEPGTYGASNGYSPGKTLFTDEDVVVRLKDFHYANGTTDFIQATISDDEIFNGDESELLHDNYIFPSNINLQFDFGALRRQVRQVCINFIDGGGVENLAVNGSDIRVLQSFVELNGQTIAPGVTARVELSDDFDFPAGTLCLTGEIDFLLIGGQELALDDVCFRTDDDSTDDDTCQIGNLRTEVLGCNNDGTFRLKLNFENQLQPSDSFFVKFRGETLGRFAVSQLPLTFNNLRNDDTPHAENIVVCLQNNEQCCAEYRFFLPACPPLGDSCALGPIRFSDLECVSDSTYRVTIHFEREHTSGLFVLRTSGGFLREFQYGQLPLRILLPIPATDVDVWMIEDAQDTTCTQTVRVPLPCRSNQNCALSNPRFFDLECIEGNRYRVTIKFDHNRPNGKFVLQSQSGYRDTFSYSQLPLRLPIPRPNDSLDVLSICDLNSPNCCTFIQLRLPCQDEEVCALSNPRFFDLECIEGNRYRVTIKFDHNRPNGKFVLQSQSGYRDTFSYSQLPLRLPIPRPNDSLDVLSICDLNSPNCCTFIQLRLPCRDTSNNNCDIQSLTAQPTRCADGKFMLKVAFRAQNTGSLGYLIFVDGQLFGPFRYSQTEQVLGPFTADGLTIYDVLVLDVDDPSCYAYTEVQPVRCNDCNISNVKAEPLGCNTNGTFNLRLNFTHQNSPSDSFFVKFRGETLGRFAISQLPLTINNLRGDDTPRQENIVVCFANNCCAEVNFLVPNCQNTAADTCRISNIVARKLPCDSIGRFYVKLKFESEHTGSGGFTVRGNGRVYGTFQYAQDSILIGPLRGDGSTVYEFVIQDNQKPNCQDFIEIDPVACEEQVWPGDANVNNRADHIDLLNIGLAYGKQGPARGASSIAWQERRALSWENTFADGTNYAHADCNGDGIVNVRDREAIARNYGLTHGAIQPVTPLPGTSLDPPIFVDLPDTTGLPAGVAFTAPVVLGSANNFVRNIYGIAFTVSFNPRVIDPASIQISYPKSWFGTENSDFITFHKIDTAAGLIHIAVTRTDQRNVTGFGAIAFISGVIDDIAGIVPDSEVEVMSVHAINLNQELLPVYTPKKKLVVKQDQETEVSWLNIRRSLRILPNPTSDWVQITTKYRVPVHSIEVLDANGKPVQQAAFNTDRISIESLPQGIYILRIKIGEYILNERIVKF